jgi:hypothetical protein
MLYIAKNSVFVQTVINNAYLQRSAMIVSLIDVLGFLLLCFGAKVAAPPLLKLLCRIAVAYIAIFSISYYFWLLTKFHAFKSHPEFLHSGISAAFLFVGFWKLFANLVLLQSIVPAAAILLLYFSVRWLSAKTGPGTSYY